MNNFVELNWRSILRFHFPSGYTVSSEHLIRNLNLQGAKIAYQCIRGVVNNLIEPDLRILGFPNRHPYSYDRPEVVYSVADNFVHNSGKYKIGYTMLEVNGIPQHWVKNCNLMNEIWVPSHFNYETFRNSGVTVPIHVMPLGIDPNVFYPKPITTPDDNFTFLYVMCWQDRKKPNHLIEAFLKAFEGKKDVVLLCKINSTPNINVYEEMKKLGIPELGTKIKIIQNPSFTHHQMASLYNSVDCLIHPTRGEGWGMPILEALACGIPAIATAWGGQTDFLNENTGYPIRVKKLVETNSTDLHYKGFSWAEPDLDHMIELMQFVYANREAVRAQSIKTASKIIKQWTWTKSAQQIISRLKSLGYSS